jgi:hypothetical protein
MKKQVLVLFFLAAACSDDQLPKPSKLGSLRVLGFQVQTSPPSNRAEFDAGENLTISPIVSDLQGSGLQYSVQACIDPGIAFGAEPTCESNPSKVDLTAGFVAMSAPTAADSYTGLGDSFSVSLPSSAVMFANRSDEDRFNGVSYLIIYKLKSASSEVTSFKRLLVSQKSTKNQNPDLAGILVNGATLSTYPFGQVVQLQASVNVGAENYQVKSKDGSLFNQSESLFTSWFISDGELTYSRTDSNQSTTQLTAVSAAPSGRKTFVMAILRDNRGGSDAVVFSQ